MNSFSGRPGVGKVDGNTTWADIVRGKGKRSRGGEELPAKAEGGGNASLLSVADTLANASVPILQKKRGGKAAEAANSAAGAPEDSRASASGRVSATGNETNGQEATEEEVRLRTSVLLKVRAAKAQEAAAKSARDGHSNQEAKV